jgi:di/tricarboxylate transporter
LLSTEQWILVGVIAAALAAIMSGRLRPDLVALLVLVTLPLTGVVDFQEAFSGFSRSVVITIIGLFMITQALEDTGVVQWIAGQVRRAGQGSETRLLLLFMAVGSALSLIMNNIAAGAVLLPAAVQVGRDSKVAPSRLLMPLAFGTLVGGMATYFTTANIILSSILVDQGQSRLNMLDFVPTGGLIVLAALAYMALIGRRLLPDRESVGQGTAFTSSHTLYETYALDERLWDAQVLPGSRLVNVNLQHSQIGQDLGLTVIGIRRGQRFIRNPQSAEVIVPGDCLVVLGREERACQMEEWGLRIERINDAAEARSEMGLGLTEVIIPPRSRVIGQSLSSLHFRNKYDLSALALWREGRSVRTDVGKLPLEVGDALLVMGVPSRIAALSKDRDFLVLQNPQTPQVLHPDRAIWALLITALVLGLSIFEIIPTAEAMLIGAAAMALTGCINLDEAYRTIEWRVVFLIAGMLPISIAMVNTGLAARIGDAVVQAVSPYGPLALVAGLFLLTMGITQVIGGQVAALIVGPIAVTSALSLGVNPQAVAVAVAIACSTAFLTPVAHPVNVLMMGPGGYSFNDFFKVGVGMTLITFVTLLLGMIIFWGV